MNQDKLRVEQNLSQFAVQNGLNYEPVHLRGFRIGNTCYESSELGSQMLSFSSNPQALSGHKDNVMIQESNNRVGEGSFGNFSCSSMDWISNPCPVMIHPGYQESHSSFVGDLSTQNSQKPYDNLHCNSSFDQHTLQDVVGNELLLRPVYADQFRLKSGVRWYTELGFGENKTVDRVDHTMTSNDNPSCQALALSLSSVPPPKVHAEHTVERDIPADMLSRFTHRNPVPLGPFTGYATILGSSKFLKPAQQLMDEFCNGGSYKNIEASPSKTLEGVGAFGDRASDLGPKMKEVPGQFCGPEGVSSSIESRWPGIAQKKAKLLYLKDEVCRRYKQYHQQMQVILSSFESVAGLTSATPYISLGLKTVARHFNCLKNAIADQLRSISNALGEDLSSPSGTSSSKGDTSGFSINFIHKSFQKQKGQCYTGFPEQAQHLVWRPQRGLPERAVSVLRAWLFDHFLHPYPTDTDKHMLASQTGLTRNQVSNWFINARVRVWKPMVEEIHMLESKGTKEIGSPNVSKTDGKSSTECSALNDVQSFNTRGTNIGSDKQMELSRISPSECQGDGPREDLHYQEKRSRVEYHIPGNMDGSFTGFLPYHRGAVSLTLGLRQSAESGQQMQAENHLRQHIGGQIVHDFVG